MANGHNRVFNPNNQKKRGADFTLQQNKKRKTY